MGTLEKCAHVFSNYCVKENLRSHVATIANDETIRLGPIAQLITIPMNHRQGLKPFCLISKVSR
jgi:hypothetical protein